METITIPKNEYLALMQLYKEITEKLERIKAYKTSKKQKINTYKYCGVLSLSQDALNIQKDMRNEWE